MLFIYERQLCISLIDKINSKKKLQDNIDI